ncbi:MAG: M3 family peptidase, partial [Planctomycetota bacterium]
MPDETLLRFSARLLLLTSVLAAGCAAPAREPAGAVEVPPAPANVLLAPWTGPYGGVPAFDRMEVAVLKPALEAAMATNWEEIEALAQDPRPASFENTIVALERAGRDLDRVQRYFGIWASNCSSPEFRAVQEEMAPKLSEHSSRIVQNAALFARVKAVHEARATLGLRPDQLRLTELTYDGFARDGALLTGAAKERYAEIQKRLAELHTRFANNVLADEEGYVLYLDG